VLEPTKPVIVCWCKQITNADIAARARECLAAGDLPREGFLSCFGFPAGKICGWCVEFPGQFLAIAEQERIAWAETHPAGAESSVPEAERPR
jgi:hypothetical protein